MLNDGEISVIFIYLNIQLSRYTSVTEPHNPEIPDRIATVVLDNEGFSVFSLSVISNFGELVTSLKSAVSLEVLVVDASDVMRLYRTDAF